MFIELTLSDDKDTTIYFNSSMLERFHRDELEDNTPCTFIYTQSFGFSCAVKETPEYILKLIKQAKEE